ncbi:MAG: L-sorbosone dehydrogenase [Candidatus Melainabacteria bacterium]|nr:MAG: L-sorbosone dehydrogenase [Candidatus Melainabacteria bacterium]
MRHQTCALVLLALLVDCRIAFSQSSQPPVQLARPYATPSVANPPRVIGWPAGMKPKAPPGFQVNVYADNLNQPRWLYVLPNGDVLVCESFAGRVTLLRDTTGNGTANFRSPFLTNLRRPFGIEKDGSTIYIACTDAVHTFTYNDGDTKITSAGKKIMDLPAFGYNNHWTRNLLIDRGAGKLYITVGSGTNVDEEKADIKDWRRAAILVSNLDGSGLRLFASGLRNPIGLALCPASHKLWTVVNERDGLGDDLVPDYLTSVKDGGFYGWPYAYFGQHEDPSHKGERPDLVAKTIVPDCALGNHVAALGLCFYNDKSFPTHYQNGVFVGEHGSWNSSKRVGYKVAYVPFNNGAAAGAPEDFLTGFAKGEKELDVYGRPVGVVVAKDGSLLVADDGAGIIWRVSHPSKNNQ